MPHIYIVVIFVLVSGLALEILESSNRKRSTELNNFFRALMDAPIENNHPQILSPLP